MDKLSQLLEKEDDVIKILNFPDTRQATEWTCGDAVAQTCLQYYGIDEHEMDLAAFLGSTEKEGTSINKIIKYLNMNGLQTDCKEMMTVNDLIYYINKDVPVIMMIQAWGGEKDYTKVWEHGHYTVAIGYTKDKILFSEPSLYNTGYIGYRELMTRWHDADTDGKRYVRFGCAVYGKPIKFNKEKITHIG
jgi:predicted double-glycine peptidase